MITVIVERGAGIRCLGGTFGYGIYSENSIFSVIGVLSRWEFLIVGHEFDVSSMAFNNEGI